MSERATILQDGGLGEARRVTMLGGRAVTLELARAGETRARWRDVYAGRVRAVDRRLRGAFVDLGAGAEAGFLPLNARGNARVGEGEIAVIEGRTELFSIEREAARGKGPVVDMVPGLYAGQKIGFFNRMGAPLDPMEWRSGESDAIDAAFEEALAKRVPIPGGGALTIEPTAALVAVDVDAGTRKGSGDAEAFALELNIAAAQEAARQLRLRNLGGIVAIDFVSMRTHSSREALEAAVKSAFNGDPWSVQRARLSRFGVLELSRAQYLTPWREILCDGDGLVSAETHAHKALRVIARAAAAQGGRRIAARVAPEVLARLEGFGFDWRGTLDGRIGARWEIAAEAGFAREMIDVRAV